MVGTMPRTELLLTKYDRVVGRFSSYSEIGVHLGVKVSDDGVVSLFGVDRLPTYIMEKDEIKYGSFFGNGYKDKGEVLKDWCRYHMISCLSSSYRIYRILD